VKKVENKTVFFKEMVECLQLIFWPGSQRRIHCHTAKPELNRRVATDWVPFLVERGGGDFTLTLRHLGKAVDLEC
jgi:hypothetical protein